MRHRTLAIQLLPLLLAGLIVAAVLPRPEACAMASRLALSLFCLRSQAPLLRADLNSYHKLEWVALGTLERIAPFLDLGGLECVTLVYLRQRRRRYEV